MFNGRLPLTLEIYSDDWNRAYINCIRDNIVDNCFRNIAVNLLDKMIEKLLEMVFDMLLGENITSEKEKLNNKLQKLKELKQIISNHEL